MRSNDQRVRRHVIMRKRSASIALLMGLLAGCVASREPPSGLSRDDTVVAGEVRRALAADAQCECSQVYVESYRGAVQLSGRVSTTAQRNRAVALARGVPGVVTVTNEIEVQL